MLIRVQLINPQTFTPCLSSDIQDEAAHRYLHQDNTRDVKHHFFLFFFNIIAETETKPLVVFCKKNKKIYISHKISN